MIDGKRNVTTAIDQKGIKVVVLLAPSYGAMKRLADDAWGFAAKGSDMELTVISRLTALPEGERKVVVIVDDFYPVNGKVRKVYSKIYVSSRLLNRPAQVTINAPTDPPACEDDSPEHSGDPVGAHNHAAILAPRADRHGGGL